MTTKIIIVDDEEGARESLSNIIDQYFLKAKVIAKADNIEAAHRKITTYKPDLVLLDIEMPFGSGFDLLNKFDKIDFDIIFITAYDHYALKAIKYAALDYLLKPVDLDELRQAIKKHQEKPREEDDRQKSYDTFMDNLQHPENHKGNGRKVGLPDGGGLTFVNLDEILRCESEGNYTNIYLTSGKKILVAKTMGEYEEQFKGENFFRIHRSHLINVNHLKKFVKGGSSSHVLMSDGSKADVSRRKKSEFIEFLSGI